MAPLRKSAKQPTIALRPSLPRKWKAEFRQPREPREPRQPRQPRGTETTSKLCTFSFPNELPCEESEASVYERAVKEHIRQWWVELFSFHYGRHEVWVQNDWWRLRDAVRQVFCHCFVKVVDWDTLDTHTQTTLTGWAPKAKEYLENATSSQVIWEAWLWRIIVDRVIHGPGDHEHWKAYSTLLDTIEGIQPDLMPEAVNETGWREGWREVMAARLEPRSTLWRCLTLHLMAAAGHQRRHTVEHVVQLVFQTLGRWLVPGEDTLRYITAMAERAVGLDWHIHSGKIRWEFSFLDPNTGKAHGFPFKKTKHVTQHKLNWKFDLEGRPVDMVVEPLIKYGADFRSPLTWDRAFHKDATMVVAVDLFPEYDGSAEVEEAREEAQEEAREEAREEEE